MRPTCRKDAKGVILDIEERLAYDCCLIKFYPQIHMERL